MSTIDIELEQISFFAIRTKGPEGKWYAKKRWTTDLRQARMYGKIGPAKRMVTEIGTWNTRYDKLATIPDIVEFKLGSYIIHDQIEI